jgi:hypothetical protein
VISTCPECGTPGVPLLFGLPVPEAREAAVDGRLALGGCLLPDDPPNWQCLRAHQWRDTDEGAWQQRLVEVLAAYGYHDPDDLRARGSDCHCSH